MIQNNEDIEKYTENNKIYIPEEYINQNNKYRINNETITIITNENCNTQYTTTYCDCKDYNIKYNIITETYQCNRNPSNGIIASEYITSDINNSERITNDFVKDYGILLLMLIAIILIVNLFKRNSRNI